LKIRRLLFVVYCGKTATRTTECLGPEQLNSLAYNGNDNDNGNGNGNKQHQQQLRAICLFNLI